MTVLDAHEVERNYELLTRRVIDHNRRIIAAENAVTARKVVQAFEEFARALRRSAASRGSEVDHAVTVDLAHVCEQRVRQYTDIADEFERIARGES